MISFNETMTVQQLTDIVTFLHEHYEEQHSDYDEPIFYGP